MQTFLLFAIIQSHISIPLRCISMWLLAIYIKFQEELFVHASMTHSSS